MNRAQVTDILLEIAVLLDLQGESTFKIRAYQNGARALETISEPLEVLVAEKRLGTIKGIGESLQQKITEMVTTGKLEYYDQLKAAVPPGLLEMLQIPSLGPKKVKAIHDNLGISTVADLEAACKAGRLSILDGFGARTEAKILEGIDYRRKYASKHLLVEAILVAEPILAALKNHPVVQRCSTAGSLRRLKEVIGDVDFVVSSQSPAEVIEFFVNQPGIVTVLAKGDTKSSVILPGGIQADLRVVSDQEYPYALAYFSGSKEHNIVMRHRAIQKGLRLSEYGLFRSAEETRDPALQVPCSSEEDIYKALDLPFITPELREDRGEFTAAEKGALPELISWDDLKGSLHNHTDWSDGQDSLETLAAALVQKGYSYWAVTDHSKAAFQAHGLDEARLKTQLAAVADINKRLEDSGISFRFLTGAEVDIVKTGLDFNDEILSQLDVVVASLHVASQDESENTQRLIAAAQNPYVHMLGHLSGRLLLRREPFKISQQAVIDACADTGTWLELNAQPSRFDLDWRLWVQNRGRGIKCSINCDAHSLVDVEYLRFGIGQARKAWLTKADVINTSNLNELRELLGVKRAKVG
jgi:DNA polymerase (family 10)